MKWREWRRKSCRLEAPVSELEVVDELAEYMAYCGATRGNLEAKARRKIIDFNFLREQ